ncbi:hypothetical protein MKZ38_010680 [Zalerion maritima]|uniref:Uncharacterized protein n=1 Tax=Zalerion maritima TaxID=339359 RepID=A0AAD5RTP7_9PEZI|nr:hypothetical protein MKZ38_010680 [Zalerion maritima]
MMPALFPIFKRTVLGTYLLALVQPSIQATEYKSGSCVLTGNSDIYGIGLRLSYYLAAFSAVIAISTMNKASMKDCLKGVNIISFAILIILIKNTVEDDESYALFEWLVIFPMVLFPAILTVFLISYEHSLLCGCCGIIYSVYGLLQPWIYWTKLYQGAKPECKPKYFIYTYIDLYNTHLVKFFRAMSIITCFFSVFTFGLALWGVWLGRLPQTSLREMDEQSRASILRPDIEIGGEEGLDPTQLTGVKSAVGLVAGFGTLFSVCTMIATSEKMLKGNDVDLSSAEFTGTSQLVPFLVGLFTFVSTVGSCWRKWRES